MKTYTSIVFLHLGILLHQVVDSRIVLRRDAENQPSEEKALECLELGDFVAVFNETSESFDCLQIAAQGPCQKGHWLFLDKDNPGGPPVCQPRECEIENEVFYKASCIEISSSSDCPNGMEVYPDAFGQSICQCKEDFIEFDGMEGCIQINTFGPCAEGEQVVRGENGGECKTSDCLVGKVKWSDGDCYFLPEDPCETRIAIVELLMVLECASNDDEEELSEQSYLRVPTVDKKETKKKNPTSPKSNHRYDKDLSCRIKAGKCKSG